VAQIVWTGNTDQFWSAAGNWTGGPPVNNATVSLEFSGTSLNAGSINDLDDLTLSFLNFANDTSSRALHSVVIRSLWVETSRQQPCQWGQIRSIMSLTWIWC